MKRFLLAGCCLVFGSLPGLVLAWEFSTPLSVSELSPGQGVHHMQTATARALAVSDTAVAVVWEDNHTGTPAIYFALKQFDQKTFSAPRKLSNDKPAFEPAIASDGNQFIVMWESASFIHGRVCDLQTCSQSQRLSTTPAKQVSLTSDAKGNLYFVWVTRAKAVYQLQAGHVATTNNTLVIKNPMFVTAAPKKMQSFPSLSVLPQGWSVAFEDREQGHTRLMTAFKPNGKAFLAPQLLNDFIDTPDARYGAGTGAMRAQLSNDGQSQVAAVWLDKRHFEGGYDVYAALSQDAGNTFATDEKVQDMLGEGQPQWHANIALSKSKRKSTSKSTSKSKNKQGKLFCAWSDPRDGSMDIWYSWRTAQGWSEDESIPQINEDGAQTNPALAFAANGVLHITYVDIQSVEGKKQSRIRYLTATPSRP